MSINIEQPSQKTFEGLYKLINYYAERKEMLPKTYDELYRMTRGFRVLVEDGKVLGSAHLDLFTPTLAEIKSLAVLPESQGQGYGRRLVTDCEREAKERGIQKLFVLTYQQTFFEKLGYQVADIKTLPEKVFKECVICPFYDNCNEIAMIKLI